ncbi:MAG: hypothetical protein PWQ70_2879 [Clostridiales bacterium]|nr:hypothetical protein [Clostridiales bacterium]
MYFTYLIVNILITKLFLNKNFFHFPLFNILCPFIFTIVDQVCIGRLFSVLYYYYSNCLRVIHIAIKPHKVNIETKNSSFSTSLVFGKLGKKRCHCIIDKNIKWLVWIFVLLFHYILGQIEHENLLPVQDDVPTST